MVRLHRVVRPLLFPGERNGLPFSFTNGFENEVVEKRHNQTNALDDVPVAFLLFLPKSEKKRSDIGAVRTQAFRILDDFGATHRRKHTGVVKVVDGTVRDAFDDALDISFHSAALHGSPSSEPL